MFVNSAFARGRLRAYATGEMITFAPGEMITFAPGKNSSFLEAALNLVKRSFYPELTSQPSGVYQEITLSQAHNILEAHSHPSAEYTRSLLSPKRRIKTSPDEVKRSLEEGDVFIQAH